MRKRNAQPISFKKPIYSCLNKFISTDCSDDLFENKSEFFLEKGIIVNLFADKLDREEEQSFRTPNGLVKLNRFLKAVGLTCSALDQVAIDSSLVALLGNIDHYLNRKLVRSVNEQVRDAKRI